MNRHGACRSDEHSRSRGRVHRRPVPLLCVCCVLSGLRERRERLLSLCPSAPFFPMFFPILLIGPKSLRQIDGDERGDERGEGEKREQRRGGREREREREREKPESWLLMQLQVIKDGCDVCVCICACVCSIFFAPFTLFSRTHSSLSACDMTQPGKREREREREREEEGRKKGEERWIRAERDALD